MTNSLIQPESAGQQTAAPSPQSRDRARRLAVVAAVLIPFAIMVWIAEHRIPSFDGGNNLQVAASMADGHGFALDYGTHQVSPQAVETSGLFLVIAAAALKVIGFGSLGLLFTNLVFILVLLGFVSLALRPWPVLQLLGPGALLLAVPDVSTWGLGGYGEFASMALTLGTFLLLGSVIEGHRRAVLLSSTGFLMLGAALTIKFVTVAAVPVAVAAVALAAYLRPDERRVRLAATALWTALPVVAWETYRLVELGGWGEWTSFWSLKLHHVRYQAGHGSQSESTISKGADHLHLLAVQTGVPAAALIAFLALPFVVLAGLALTRDCGLREWVSRTRVALALQLAGLAGLYVMWWLFITGTDKAWLRRFVIGWIALCLLYLLLPGLLRHSRMPRRSGSRTRRLLVTVLAVLALLTGVAAAASISRVARANASTALRPGNGEKEAVVAAAHRVRDIAAGGATLCGAGWWSAPVVSLLSGVSFCDLAVADLCSQPLRDALTAGQVYLVWDEWAYTLVGPSPAVTVNPAFVRYEEPAPRHSLWRFAVAPNDCAKRP